MVQVLTWIYSIFSHFCGIFEVQINCGFNLSEGRVSKRYFPGCEGSVGFLSEDICCNILYTLLVMLGQHAVVVLPEQIRLNTNCLTLTGKFLK